MELGCGLFGLAFELEQDQWGTFKKLADAGYTAVEPLYAFHDDPALKPDSQLPSFLKTILWNEETTMEYIPRLAELGLEISSMHVGFLFGAELEAGIRELIEFSKKSGIKHFMTSLEFDTQEKADAAVELMNNSAQILSGTDVTLGYHNHYMEFKNHPEGQPDITLMDYFLAKTSTDVKLELDTGWQMYGGSDAVAFMDRYPDRISAVHLKDFVKGYEPIEQDDAFAAVGDGVLPTREILAKTPSLTLIPNGVMVDQDKASVGHFLTEDLEKGAKYLQQIS